jgi:hypothetical protein
MDASVLQNKKIWMVVMVAGTKTKLPLASQKVV